MKEELQIKIAIIEKLIEADEEERVCFTRTFEKMGYDKKAIKKTIKGLKNIGMVDHSYAIDDDGMISGRGWVLTRRATQWSIREWLQELKKIEV